MVKRKSLVLVAGVGRHPFKTLARVLDRHKLEVVRVAAPENSIELARSERFDLVIIDATPRKAPLKDVVAKIRAEGSASRLTSLLVLAEHRDADAARTLIGRGVNRVMLLDDPPEIIDEQVAELLYIAPRAAVRLAIQLRTSVADGIDEVFGEIVDLSMSGMLVKTEKPFKVGQQLVVSIYPGDRDDPVVAKATVVRQALSERGGVDGCGVRFSSFAADGEVRIAAALEGAFAESIDHDFLD
jgi:hypothetical protein